MTGRLRHRLFEKRYFASRTAAEFVEPTARSRRKFVVQWSVAIAVLLIALALGKLWFAFPKSLPGCDDLPYLRATLLAWIVVPFLLGIYGLRFGRRLLVHQQWPPPGRPVFTRQRIRRGRGVRWRAYGLLATSVILLATPAWGGYLLYRSGIFSAPVAGSRCAP